MNILTRIGVDGFKLWLGVEWNSSGPSPVLLLKQKKDEIQIVQQEIFADSKELFAFLKRFPGVPIHLHLPELLGVEKCIPSPSKQVISQVLGVQVDNQNDYMWQAVPTRDGQQWVKLMRKEELKKQMAIWNELEDRVLGLSFSASTIGFLIPGLPDYQPDITYNFGNNYSWKEGLLSTKDGIQSSLEIETISSQLNLPASFVPLYGAMVHNWLAGGKDIHQYTELSKRRKGFGMQYQALRASILGFALLLLLSLGGILGNELLNIRKESGQQVLLSGRSLLDQMDRNQQTITQKSAFFQQKSLQMSKASLYLDRIGSLRPAGLQFSDLIFQGAKDRIKKISPDLITQEADIIIRGSALEIELIRNLVSQLEAQEWTQKVSLWQSSFDFRERRHFFTLTIRNNE